MFPLRSSLHDSDQMHMYTCDMYSRTVEIPRGERVEKQKSDKTGLKCVFIASPCLRQGSWFRVPKDDAVLSNSRTILRGFHSEKVEYSLRGLIFLIFPKMFRANRNHSLLLGNHPENMKKAFGSHSTTMERTDVKNRQHIVYY